MGSIPATPSTKHALCFPPSSMPASIEISVKLVVCLSVCVCVDVSKFWEASACTGHLSRVHTPVHVRRVRAFVRDALSRRSVRVRGHSREAQVREGRQGREAPSHRRASLRPQLVLAGAPRQSHMDTLQLPCPLLLSTLPDIVCSHLLSPSRSNKCIGIVKLCRARGRIAMKRRHDAELLSHSFPL